MKPRKKPHSGLLNSPPASFSVRKNTQRAPIVKERVLEREGEKGTPPVFLFACGLVGKPF
jgi:hypothetical protein